MTYDNAAILREFAQRHHIEYSLLADPQSEIIRSFGIVDPDESTDNLPAFAKKGMALAGYFLVDRKGRIKEKFFGESYYDRFTPNNLIGKLFPELKEGAGPPVTAPYLQLVTKQSDRDVIFGSRVTLAVEITLPKGTHVYAQGVQKYKPAQLVIDSVDGTPLDPRMLKESRYPRSWIMRLPAIKERVPVYEGRFSISQDLVVYPSRDVQKRLRGPGVTPASSVNLTIGGKLKYQACDARTCFLPKEVTVTWELRIHAWDNNRASEGIRDIR